VPEPPATERRSQVLSSRPRAALAVLGFGASALGLWQLGTGYGDFLIPQQGVNFVPERELAFYACYALCGGLALLCMTRALRGVRWLERVSAALYTLREQPARLCVVLSLLVFGASLGFRRLVLEGQAIADDEATYLFIARTLLKARLVNPAPADPDFFRNQFIVLNEHGWYGKYPIGHPLVLALFEGLHLRDLAVPLMAAASVPLCYALGARWFGPGRALAASALLLVSPHFVWTAGTLLSQTTAGFFLLLGLYAAMRAHETGRLRAAALAGLAFGFGMLVRPLPGALFAAVGCSWALHWIWAAPPGERSAAAARALTLCVTAAFGGIALLAVNYAQTGDLFSSGYHEVHGHIPVMSNRQAEVAHSIFGALLRESFWLFGVPGCLVPMLLARPMQARWLFWGPFAAQLVYRALFPKTVVGSTGPIYLTELVPLLVLAAVDGVQRARRALPALQLRAAPLCAAMLLTAACMFVPVQWRTLRRAVQVRSLVFQMLEQSHAENALVFSDALVFPSSGHSWAYFPDNPSPDLDDPVIFVRMPRANVLLNMQDFWRRRFPDRRAFAYSWSKQGEPLFRELSREPLP
jgi:hypothetical protein